MAYKGWNKNEIDWDSVDTSGGIPVERGIYLARCTSAKPQLTKDKKPSIQSVWTLTQTYDGEEISRTVYDTLTLTEEARFKVKQCFEACEIDPPADESEDAAKSFCDDLVGAEVWLLIGIRTWQGKDRNQIDRYLSEDEAKEAAGSGGGSKKKSKKKSRRAEPEPEEEEEDEEEEEGGDEDEEEEEEPPKKKTKRKTRGRR